MARDFDPTEGWDVERMADLIQEYLDSPDAAFPIGGDSIAKSQTYREALAIVRVR